jgi:hypothetical protein
MVHSWRAAEAPFGPFLATPPNTAPPGSGPGINVPAPSWGGGDSTANSMHMKNSNLLGEKKDWP